MTAAFSIRRLGSDDALLLQATARVMGEAFGEADEYASEPPDTGYLGQLLGGECFIALAAVEGDAAIGGLVAYELRKYERRRSEIYLYDLAVAEAWRRKGVATALIEELKAVARSRGAWVIFVQADHGDDAAIALYSKLGSSREEVLHFDIPIGAADVRR